MQPLTCLHLSCSLADMLGHDWICFIRMWEEEPLLNKRIRNGTTTSMLTPETCALASVCWFVTFVRVRSGCRAQWSNVLDLYPTGCKWPAIAPGAGMWTSTPGNGHTPEGFTGDPGRTVPTRVGSLPTRTTSRPGGLTLRPG